MWLQFAVASRQSSLANKMELESYVQSPYTKRFVVEDTFTKVTSDGEPHGMMTMIAALSGLVAAVIILGILVSMVACRKRKYNKETVATASSENGTPMTNVPLENARISTLSGNLNAAFVESTLSLGDCSCKERQQLEHTWPTDIIVQRY